jgi:acetyl-CoA carboxylase biotin carboxyl carrier protein
MALLALLDDSGSSFKLRAPAVGLWLHRPHEGSAITPGESLGTLEIMGVRYQLIAPRGARGFIAESPPAKPAALPVQYNQILAVLETAQFADAGDESTSEAQERDGGLVLRAPSSGRYYSRPAPDKSAFVSVGDIIQHGQTVGLLEVMKTFSRIHLDGEGLPTSVRVTAIRPADGDDIDAGDVILELETP